ncbi:uncharacterized protein METZ01_LOCUS6089 [marine metagenome]|uniref:Uncharacterized protein n=1 Tax=marine metagenome TaxID=408172 RepID=A0A381NF80_9ZZZZ
MGLIWTLQTGPTAAEGSMIYVLFKI